MSLRGLLGHVRNQREHADLSFFIEPTEDTRQKIGQYRTVITQRGSCNQLFYGEVTQFGSTHNGYVKMNKHSQITSFKWQGAITIDGVENYDGVEIMMETLTSDVIKEQGKYKYNGQSMQSLAYAYYTDNFDRQIVSNCSPQVYDILTSKASTDSPLVGFYTGKADSGFDVYMMFTSNTQINEL